MSNWKEGKMEIVPGAYVYVTNGGYGMNTPGIIVGDHCGLAIDTAPGVALTAEFAKEVRKEIHGKPIRYLTYTHTHPDHVFGAAAYPDAVVVGPRAVQDSFNERKITPGAHEWPVDVTGGEARDLDVLFDGKTLTIDLGNRTAELICFGNCHHDCDTVVYIPDCKVLYCGDLFYNYVWPDGAKSNVPNWLKALEEIKQMDVEYYVPGHGPVANRAEFLKFCECLQLLYDETVKGFKAGKHPWEISRTMNQGDFASWDQTHRRINVCDLIYRVLQGKDTVHHFCEWDINAEVDRVRHSVNDFGPHHRIMTEIKPEMDPETWVEADHRVEE